MAGLPDYQAQLLKTVTDKKAVLTEVESQQGRPFKYEARLAQARVMCTELDGKLKASIAPPKPAPSAEASTSDAEVDPALGLLRKLHVASFPSALRNTHPTPVDPMPQGRNGPSSEHIREGSSER